MEMIVFRISETNAVKWQQTNMDYLLHIIFNINTKKDSKHVLTVTADEV